MTENQVATVEDQVVAPADKQIVSPVKNTTNFGALFSLKGWEIVATPDRDQLCIWWLIATTKFLSILSIISFWLCAIMCIKTLPAWNGLNQVFNGYRRRALAIQAGNPVPVADRLWEDLFPAAEILESYTLKLIFAETGRADAAVIGNYPIPFLAMHPFFWAGVMALSFLAYHFLSFTHGCLQRINPAAKTISRRRSLT